MNLPSLWVTLDDNEAHYFKVMADEVFGRQNFISTVIWEKSDSPKMDSVFFSSRHDFLLVYAKNIDACKLNRVVDESDEPQSHFNKISEDGRKYYTKPLRAMGSGDDTREARPTLFYPIEAPDGTLVYPKRQDGVDGRWRWKLEKVMKDKHLIEWVKGKNGWSPYYRIFDDPLKGRPAETIWTHQEVGSNRTSKIEIKAIFENEDPFTTPKPEKLIKKVIGISTNPGDLVLDSFLGSGTTAAVAHKMGRRWIGIELGDHAFTHCQPRLKKVIEGELGGISKSVNWQGGGGFRFFKLAPTLLTEDKWGNLVINPEYNAEMLAEALCKLEGFRYQPSPEHYWQQGQSTENDFIYTTTQILSQSQLEQLSEEVGPDRTLLVLCNAFKGSAQHLPNLTVKKIPKHVLNKCEWGKSDYSLQIQNLPDAPPKGGQFGLNFDT